jgi:hypothetical protein
MLENNEDDSKSRETFANSQIAPSHRKTSMRDRREDDE